MATTLKKGVEAASELAFEEPINLEDDWKDEYGHSKEAGFVYNIVDFTDVIQSAKPSMLNDYRRAGWKTVGESKYQPGFWLVRISEEGHRAIRAKAEGAAVAMAGKDLGFTGTHASAQMDSSQSETTVSTDQIVKALQPG